MVMPLPSGHTLAELPHSPSPAQQPVWPTQLLVQPAGGVTVHV
jgi:hypothetical protein